ncbi:MAG: fibronectin type III domain-containing protein [Deltaproteobacteria bacterium]|nr:fibronectin type III domain-containing protein [Deltaproteobacteria bacterium]
MRTLHAAFLLIFLSLWGADVHAARLQLSWTDNSLNERGFSIERRQGEDSTFSVIATQGVNVESYADNGLLPATSYCYRVRAFNDAGYSGYSNESCTTTSPIEMSFEGPSDTQSVAGLGVIRGWSFDARLGQQIKALKLFIDDAQVLRIPCCSPRGDVQAGFPQLPAQNTLNSGWGTAVNWGALASGTHVVQLRAESTSGQTLATDRHTVTTVRFADFSFVDLFSVAQAAVWIDGNDLVVERVVVRDKNSQRQAQVTMRLRWLSNEQSFRVVATETTAHAAAPHSVLSPVLAAVRKWLPLGPAVAAAQSSTPILGMIESPGFGQVSAGIGVLRGWAFSGDSAATIRTIQAFVDGQSIGTLPCCSARGDVGASFPNYPAASNSGWGAVVNFGALPTGPHTISIQVTDSRGMTQAFERRIATIRIGDATFVDDLSLADATARIEDEDLVINGVHVRDAATQETSDVTLRLRWIENSQSLGIIAATAQ